MTRFGALFQNPFNIFNKARSVELLPECFENSENRVIFSAWQQVTDISSIRDILDNTLWEHLDDLINKNIPANQIEQRFESYLLRLREEYLKRLERKRGMIFALEAEAGGSGADLVKLKEEGMEPSIQLGKVFSQKARRGQEQRR